MIDNVLSIEEVLNEELEKRCHITGNNFKASDLFDSTKVSLWMRKILGCDGNKILEKRINNTKPERISHVAATYLLGLSVYDHLQLNFDYLPRIVPYSASGDAFQTFWALICLCHDLGYQYENDDKISLSDMEVSEKRCELFGVEHDLLALDKDRLLEFGLKEYDNSFQWILDSLDLAKKYDAMRRQTLNDNLKFQPVIDHGIAGAIILYDMLFREYKNASERSAQVVRPITEDISLRNSENNVDNGVIETIIHDANTTKLLECALLIACTVARHNMWNAKGEADCKRYRKYGLNLLCEGETDSLVDSANPLNQMLFLLDFMDTVDPIKSFFTRWKEKLTYVPSKKTFDQNINFLLKQICFEFFGSSERDYRWEKALTYRELSVSIRKTASGKNKIKFNEYLTNVQKLSDWLKTKRPVCDESGLRITLYYPTIPHKDYSYVGGITEHEINALLLYEGCGVPGKFGDFYSLSSPYQTFNLLMMKGDEGERIRVCQEKRNPYGFYIRNWEKMLEVFTDIFSAQCKYLCYCKKNKTEKIMRVYRVDRKANFDMMHEYGSTFALTSTSKVGFLNEMASQKVDVRLLEIELSDDIPYLDYSEVLGSRYIFSSEKEILIPPFIEASVTNELELTEEEKHRFHEGVRKYSVQLSQFNINMPENCLDENDEEILIRLLDQDKEDAANILDQMRESRKMPNKADIQKYLLWKSRFQRLCWLCMRNIYRAYFNDKLFLWSDKD